VAYTQRQGVVVEGLKEAVADLRNFPPALMRRFRTSVTRSSAATLATAVSLLESRAKKPRGDIAGILRVRVTTSASRVGAFVGGTHPGLGTVLFGRVASHGGHGHHNPHIRHLTPNPALTDAIRLTRPEMLARIANDLRAALAESFRGP
jgi:hypothetical protein